MAEGRYGGMRRWVGLGFTMWNSQRIKKQTTTTEQWKHQMLQCPWKNWVSYLLVGMNTDTAILENRPRNQQLHLSIFPREKKSLHITQNLYMDVLRLAVLGKHWKLPPSSPSTYTPCTVGGLFSALLTVYLCSQRRRMTSEMETISASQQLLSKLWCIKKIWAVGINDSNLDRH